MHMAEAFRWPEVAYQRTVAAGKVCRLVDIVKVQHTLLTREPLKLMVGRETTQRLRMAVNDVRVRETR